MKRLFLLITGLLILQTGFSYSWESYGPEGIKANKMVFAESGAFAGTVVIFVDTGMYIGQGGIYSYNFDYLDLAANDAFTLDNDSLFVTVGGGSYSDGIYVIDLETLEYNVVQYCPNPHFILHVYGYPSSYYTVGYESGLLKSFDRYNWEEVPFFSGKNCLEMGKSSGPEFVKTGSELYISDGDEWNESTEFREEIHDLTFGPDDYLYGIYEGEADSSGLWCSVDYGDTWSFMFNSLNISSLSDPERLYPDKYGNIFNVLLIGWQDSYEDFEGIAEYNINEPPPGLTFFNDGLPNTNVYDITCTFFAGKNYLGNVEPVSGNKSLGIYTYIYVCTDEGIFVNDDYLVGIDEQKNSTGSFAVYPNPVTQTAYIKIDFQNFSDGDNKIYILDNRGSIVDDINIENSPAGEMTIKWDKGDLPAGVYYIVMESKDRTLSKKFIIL